LAAWIGVLGIALVGVGLLARRIAPRFRWLRAGVFLLGVALIALTASNAMLLWPRMHEAVVLINQTPARVSPVPMGDTAFVLREAETVTMTAEHEDFVLIRTRGGLSGWVAFINHLNNQSLAALSNPHSSLFKAHFRHSHRGLARPWHRLSSVGMRLP
jgi:hypothetical protein